MLVIAKLLMDVCVHGTLSIPVLNRLLIQLWAHFSLQPSYHYSVTQSRCWLLPLNRSNEITQQSTDWTKNECNCGLRRTSSLSPLPTPSDYRYYTDTKFTHTPSPLFSASEKQLVKELIKGLPMWWTDSAVLNDAVLVLPLFMLFTLQAKSSPRWMYD